MRLRLMIAATALALGTSSCWADSLAGVVLDDATGMPVPRASISLFRLRTTPLVIDFERTDFETATAGDGTFQTINLASGNHMVAVGCRGYLYSTIFVAVTDKTPVMPFLHVRLVKLGMIEGQLTGLRGRSARVLALVKSIDPKLQDALWKPVLGSIDICCNQPASLRGVAVDPDGQFRIPDLPPATYALVVAYGHTAYGDSRVPDSLAPIAENPVSSTGLLRFPDGTGGLDLRSGATLTFQLAIPNTGGRQIEGRIELPEGQPWYWVTLSNPEQPALAVAITTTDATGDFSFRGVAPGSYELLAVAGMGQRGAPLMMTPEMTVYHGFFRAAVDVREHDAPGIVVVPRSGISSSVALQGPNRDQPTWCGNESAVLTPFEDWGINMERRITLVKVTPEGSREMPEPIAGLAPARYGLSTVGQCPVRDHPVLNLSLGNFSDTEAAVALAGTVRGHTNVTAETSAGWEAILIPDDFTDGRSFLPANWFSWPQARPLRLLEALTWRGEVAPYVRLANPDVTGRFEFDEVPAGRYKLALRSTDPKASTGPMWGDMKQIEVSSSTVLTVDLAAPNPTPLK